MAIDKLFVLTGPPGSGKSTLLSHLRALGFACIDEPARQILAEQRSIRGNGLPAVDARLFVDLMLSRMICEYQRIENTTTPVFFDRGVPDMLAYASLSGFDYQPGWNAAEKYRYNERVFFAPAWEEIYTTDDERTMSFELTSQFADDLRSIYPQCGYDLLDLPCVSVQERAEFILSHL